MKKAPLILIILFFTGSLCAQKIKKEKTIQKSVAVQPSKTKPRPIPVFLGHSDISGGALAKNIFDSLMKQGLSAHDSAGKTFTVEGFMFTYAERNLYEDSAANLQYMTDYLREFCPGDTISGNVAASLFDRTKIGDTLYFDDIRLKSQEGWNANGKAMKFEITK